MSSLEVAKLYATFELDAAQAIEAVNKAVPKFVALDRALAALDSTSNRLQAEMNVSNKTIDAASKAVSKAEAMFEDFDKALKSVGDHVNEVEAGLKQMPSALERIGSGVGKVTQGYFFLSNGLRDAASAFKTVFDAANEGARIGAAQQFFENSGKSLTDLRNATRGMISDAELMRKSNLADSMGISQETFKKLAQVAQASALKTGQSFDYMFESIIVGTARSSRLLLDNLGIIVSVEEANKRYAKAALEAAGAKDQSTTAVNKFIEAMDSEQKQMAFANEVARQSKNTLSEYGQVTDRTAEKFDRFSAELQNLSDTIKRTLAGEFGGGGLLGWLTKTIQNVNILTRGLAEMTASDFFQYGLFGGASKAGARAKAQGYEENAQRRADIQADVDKLVQRVIQHAASSPITVPGMESGINTPANVMELAQNVDFVRQAAESSDLPLQRLAVLLNQIREQAAKIDKTGNWAESTKPLVPNYLTEPPVEKKGSGRAKKDPADELAKALRDYNEEAEARRRDLVKDLVDEERERLDIAKENLKSALDFWESWDKQAEKNKREAEKKAAAEDKAAAKAEERDRKAQERQDARDYSAISGVASQIAGGGGVFGPIMGVAGPAIGGAIGGPIGAIIGGVLPVLGQIADTLKPVIGLIGAIVDGLTLFVSNGLLETLTALLAPLNDSIQFLLASLGILVGNVLRSLVPGIALLAAALAGLINFVSMGIVIFSPFFEAVMSISNVLWGAVFGFDDLGFTVGTVSYAMKQFTESVIDGAIYMNNFLVEMIRTLPGMGKFGKMLKESDFKIDHQVTSDNTDATRENTAAVRDLAREFRNLPQFYKAQGTMFAVQDAESFLTEGQRSYFDQRARASVGGRFRT